MTWTAPATWTTNQVVSATDMNTQIRDNLTYLKVTPHIIKADITETTFSNSAVETTMWSASIGGGTFGASEGILVEFFQSWLNNSGGTRTITVRVKYGGTTMITNTPTPGTSATTFGAITRVLIKNTGATNSQKATGVTMSQGVVNVVNYGTAAIDSTASQTLAITLQSDAATATQTYTHLYTNVLWMVNT